MSSSNRPLRKPWLVAFCLLLVAASASAQDEAPLDAPEIQRRRDAARAALSPPDVAPEERTRLEEQVRLLLELQKLQENASVRNAEFAGVAKRMENAKRAQEELDRLPAPTAPTEPTPAGFEKLKAELATLVDQTSEAEATLRAFQDRREQLPSLLTASQRRADDLATRVGDLAEALVGASDDADKRRIELDLQNAKLDRRLALRTAEQLQSELDRADKWETLRTAELELLRQRSDRLDVESGLYGAVLEAALALERSRRREELDRRAVAARAAGTPAEKLVAQWEEGIALSRASGSEFEGYLVGLRQDLGDAEKRLKAEQEELANLKEYLERTSSSEGAASRIKTVYASLKDRRQALQRGARPGLLEVMTKVRERRFAIEDSLFALADGLRVQIAEVTAKLDAEGRTSFGKQTADLLNRARTALREEKAVCTDVIAVGQQLQRTHLERQQNFGALERYVRTKIFWVQDGKPLGREAFSSLGEEASQVAGWASRLGSSGMKTRLGEALGGARGVLIGLLLFPVLPALLFYGRRRLRRLVRSRNERVLETGHTLGGRLLTTLGGIVTSAILPIYVLAAGRLVGAADLPGGLSDVAGTFLTHAGVFLFAWFLAHSYLRPGGTMLVQYRMDPDAARSLHRGVRLLLVAYLFFFVPWLILGRPPFSAEALPRIAYTAGELLAAFALWRLIRTRSPFVAKGLVSIRSSAWLARHWWAFASPSLLLVLAALAMDFAGYRYGSRYIATSLVWSIVALLVLMMLQAATHSGLAGLLRKRRRSVVAAPGSKPEPRVKLDAQLLGFVRVVFLVVGVLILAALWGFDRQAVGVLEDIHLHEVLEDGQVVKALTLADVLASVLWMLGTIWLLRNLPGIYEVALFPRLKLDPGVKYALLTISRYALFTVGFILALGALKLNLSSLGWLMATMGVGLGFGMQEIVSNFVCGIILLVERPIRVGDLVTVGDKSGRVMRINIRATTILDFDRQEIIVPNRSFITAAVTNLTGGDTIIRLIVGVGVAYGSDPDAVTEILMGIIEEQKEVLRDPAPSVIFMKHGESSLDFELRVFLPDPSVKMKMLDRLNKSINAALERHGIEIPFPQRDLYIRSSVLPAPASS